MLSSGLHDTWPSFTAEKLMLITFLVKDGGLKNPDPLKGEQSVSDGM